MLKDLCASLFQVFNAGDVLKYKQTSLFQNTLYNKLLIEHNETFATPCTLLIIERDETFASE